MADVKPKDTHFSSPGPRSHPAESLCVGEHGLVTEEAPKRTASSDPLPSREKECVCAGRRQHSPREQWPGERETGVSQIERIIQLDLDLKYKTNIRELFEEFDHFLQGAVIGIAREMQPVYRHTFWQFRRENPQTKVGEPPPDGLPGFNSGVMLLNLEAMRQSQLYNQLLEPDMVRQLTEKYHFKGHLGDQDFFTMIGMEHPELFHVLHCTWNRQLCSWWREHGYSDVFDQYFRCEGQVRIYHGNCNTPIPED
ncbi:xyloside xylosyltransferase 1 isoform X3 [Gopherus flavomarginatus]|uniref:xyloside xylosyltransferase 1 isoform X3 n=1 Tax=Gopherus flavomarginatus TaxID=286002 RepID=UPI0021CC28B2|nr:xyloside xylosyltransferase 1 isoform X3 [Gopherus flavomarginatus]